MPSQKPPTHIAIRAQDVPVLLAYLADRESPIAKNLYQVVHQAQGINAQMGEDGRIVDTDDQAKPNRNKRRAAAAKDKKAKPAALKAV